MVDFVGALQAGTAALSVAKELAQINRDYDKAELMLKIATLSQSLATVQMALTDAQTEIAEKDREIVGLKESFRRRDDETVEHHGYVYQKGEDGKPIGLPFCPRCMADGRMQLIVRSDRQRTKMCPECRREYNATAFLYPDQRVEE